MEVSSSPSPSPSSSRSQPRDSEMDATDRLPFSGEETGSAAAVWDWGDLLDFTVDGDLSINWSSAAPDAPPPPPPPHPPQMDDDETTPAESESDAAKVRKRDPRLTCTNFLAGIVPCACPELDERLMELEEEEAGHDKKRLRTRGGGNGGARAATGGAKCQVPSCGADIKELKGYHRRHRVCLRCANATTVVIAGEDKRYCQQCGKFHILPDFDEGKRSCRRKLERHNNRRRRKPAEPKGAAEKESPGDVQSEDVSGDGEAGKDASPTESQLAVKETCVESEGGHIYAVNNTTPDANSDGVASLLDSGETQMDTGKYSSKHGVSVSYSNKSAYSSLCPTGRISFKLYDWNPAEFPRRLRHQIFQWLANMPIELEGYIRPGCIILTVFIAMPRFMWIKLSEDPISYVHNFVVAPGGMLSGRGNILVYLNNTVFHVRKGGTAVLKAKVDVRAPRLHYVNPICFEAGKPMEFVACGSNLLQPKLRFLVSFAGKYLAHNCGPASSHCQTEWSGDSNFNHQLYQIHVPHTEANHFGPVFIEVENEAGVSNFIPVLIGDKETCYELKNMQQRHDDLVASDRSCSCEASSLRQIAFSEVIVDIAWLLKKPGSESINQVLKTFQVQRLECLLSFLISIESTTIVEKILQNLETSIDRIKSNSSDNVVCNSDLRLLQKYMDYAHQRRWTVPTRNLLLNKYPVSRIGFPVKNLQDTEITVDGKLEDPDGSVYDKGSETIPILSKKRFSKVTRNEKWSNDSSYRASSMVALRFRPTLCLIAVAAICLGVCSVIFHPHKVSEFAISIRRCVLNKM